MSLQDQTLTVAPPASYAVLGFAAAYAVASLPAVVWGPPLPAGDLAAGSILASALVLASAIDVRTFRLPDVLTLPLTAAGLLAAHGLGWEAWPERLIAAAAAFLSLALVRQLYYLWRKQHGLGLGDAKLFAAAGAWTGLHALPAILLIACLLALLGVAGFAMSGRPLTARTAIPFGPFIAAGTWLGWLYGAPL
jgi:leader peptidase (prepilin peptidase)/N-methyltransferase